MSRINKNQLALILKELDIPVVTDNQATLHLWQIEPINTRLNNQLWLLSKPSSKQKLICRITQANNRLTKDSQNGIRLQQQLSDIGISAKIHHHIQINSSQMNDITITLMDYIEGTTNSANHWSEQQREIFAKQLARLHQSTTKLPLEKLDITAHLNGYIQKLKGKLDRQKLIAYQQALEEITQQINQLIWIGNLLVNLNYLKN